MKLHAEATGLIHHRSFPTIYEIDYIPKPAWGVDRGPGEADAGR